MEASETLTALQKVVAAQAAPVVRFNTELVRSAWSAVRRRLSVARSAARKAAGDLGGYAEPVPADPLEYAHIEQLWTDYIIVRVDDGGDALLRIPYTVEDPATAPEHVKFGKPERVRVAYVAACAQRGRTALDVVVRCGTGPDVESLIELSRRRVRTQAGSNRYRKPIGASLGDGVTGEVGEAMSKDAVNRADSLRGNIKDLAGRDKTYRGGKVFGDLGNEGKLKNALSSIEKLPEGRRGEAAAEIVLAAQALGLTRLVPTQVKRLYRAYIAQKPAERSSGSAAKK